MQIRVKSIVSWTDVIMRERRLLMSWFGGCVIGGTGLCLSGSGLGPST